MTDECIGELNQTLGNTALIHDLAHKHKEGNCEQRKAVHPGYHPARQDSIGQIHKMEHGQIGEPQGEYYRNTDQDRRKQY